MDTPAGQPLPVELLVAHAGRRMAARALSAVETVGISEGAWCVLHELARAEDGLALVDITRRTSFSASTVTAVTDQLAARGLLARDRATDDRRKVVAGITEQGRQVLSAGLARARESFTDLQDRFTDAERRVLHDLVTRLIVGDQHEMEAR